MLVKIEPLIKTAAASFLVVVLGGALFVYGSDVSQDLLSRALLGNVDVPRKTRVEEISKDAVVAIGDPFTIEARARGINPDSGDGEGDVWRRKAAAVSDRAAADGFAAFCADGGECAGVVSVSDSPE